MAIFLLLTLLFVLLFWNNPNKAIKYVYEDEFVDIYIFRQLGKVTVPFEDILSDSIFETSKGLKGTYYKINDHDRVCDFIILENRFFGVSITMAYELYEQNEKEINGLLDSIEIEFQ